MLTEKDVCKIDIIDIKEEIKQGRLFVLVQDGNVYLKTKTGECVKIK